MSSGHEGLASGGARPGVFYFLSIRSCSGRSCLATTAKKAVGCLWVAVARGINIGNILVGHPAAAGGVPIIAITNVRMAIAGMLASTRNWWKSTASLGCAIDTQSREVFNFCRQMLARMRLAPDCSLPIRGHCVLPPPYEGVLNAKSLADWIFTHDLALADIDVGRTIRASSRAVSCGVRDGSIWSTMDAW